MVLILSVVIVAFVFKFDVSLCNISGDAPSMSEFSR